MFLPSLPEKPEKLRLSIHDMQTCLYFQLAVLVPGPLKIKLRVFASFYWNLWDAVAIVWFTIGVILRFNPSTLNASRIVYTLNIVFFYIRILGILSVNKALGAYSKIIGKLVSVWVWYFFFGLRGIWFLRSVLINFNFAWNKTLFNTYSVW